MKKGSIVQKTLLLLFVVMFIIAIILLENTDGIMQDYINIIWVSVSFFIAIVYIFLATYHIYIKYDYYSMRSYVSDLSIKTCEDYIQHKNIYDTLKYTLEKIEENRFYIIFSFQIVRGHDYVAQVVSPVRYQVNLYENETGTEITCMFVRDSWFKKAILPWYIDRFIEQKFNAKRREISYSID